jgi:hypothetical protein
MTKKPSFKETGSFESKVSAMRRLLEKHKCLQHKEVAYMFSSSDLSKMHTLAIFPRIRFVAKVNHHHFTPFKKEFYRKTFICLNETEKIRLAEEAMLFVDDIHKKHAITTFLRRNFSKAQTAAILLHLGDFKNNKTSRCRVANSIELNGKIKPAGMWKHFGVK